MTTRWCGPEFGFQSMPKGQDYVGALSMLRVMGEELVIAGFPSGDRNIHLANLRALMFAVKEYRALLAKLGA